MGYSGVASWSQLPRLPRPPRSVAHETPAWLATCPVCRTGDETGPLYDDGATWPAHPTCTDWQKLPPVNPGIRSRH